MKFSSRSSDLHVLEARAGARIAAQLSTASLALPADVAERLRFARESAVGRARELRLATPAGPVLAGVSARGTATLAGFTPWWQRAASVLPLLLLLGGLLLIDQWSMREQVLTAADIDARLLADKLPPAAYADPGFAEYLRSASGQ